MEHKQRKLPGSRKAMEYRVYWLERKLTHLKLNEKRELAEARIEEMPDSPMKELLHLNNEFHRANEKAAGLNNFTDELNKDTLTLNERTERLHELGAEKLANTDRLNRQSQRLQDRSQQINKESLRTTALSRAINKASKEAIGEVEKRVDEANYLSNLMRGQHAATDELNRKTRNLNQETVKATAMSLKLNRDLADTTDASRRLNEKSRLMQAELSELKQALAAMSDDNRELNARTENDLVRLAKTDSDARAITEKAEKLYKKSQVQIKAGTKMLEQAEHLNDLSAKATESNLAVQQTAETQIEHHRKAFETLDHALQDQVSDLIADSEKSVNKLIEGSEAELSKLTHSVEQSTQQVCVQANQEVDAFTEQAHRDISEFVNSSREEVADLISMSQEEIEAHQARQTATLLQLNKRLTQKLEDRVGTALETSEQKLQKDSQKNMAALEASARTTEATAEALKTNTLEQTDQAIRQFDLNAEDRFSKFESHTQSELDEFSQQSENRLTKADSLLDKLTQRAVKNFEEGEQFVAETHQLNVQTREINDDTLELNVKTEALFNRSQEAIQRIDGAIQEVNTVSEKLHLETQELQDRSSSLNQAGERLIAETNDINLQSRKVQAETLQTQTLGEEINNRSKLLNQETEQLHANFTQSLESNARLVTQLGTLKSDLSQAAEDIENQLAETRTATQEGRDALGANKDVTEETRILNARTNALISAATETITTSRQHNDQTGLLIASSERMQEEMNDLKDALILSRQQALDAADAANDAVDDITSVKRDLISATGRSEAATEIAESSITAMQALSSETKTINQDAKTAQAEMRLAVDASRQINDEFMRGLESVTAQANNTDKASKAALQETRELQEEIHGILQLKHGIDGFQVSVDSCQERIDNLTATVRAHHEDDSGQTELINQYQRRIDAFQQDVNRYRDAVLTFESRTQHIETVVQETNHRLDDNDAIERDRHSAQIEQMRRLEQDLHQSLIEKQAQVDSHLAQIQEAVDKNLSNMRNDLHLEVDAKLDAQSKETESRLVETNQALKILKDDFGELNQSLLSEIQALKSQTSAVKDQHYLFQQEQRSQVSEQKKRAQNQDFQIESVKHQLENNQRLMETQLDNQPQQKIQERMKSLEASLRQQQRLLKTQEAQQDRVQDDRLEALKKTVDALGRSLQEVVSDNDGLKKTLGHTQTHNQTLVANNEALSTSLQASQDELNACLSRIQRLESKEANVSEVISTLKSRDSDTQQTLIQMRSAVKDSTRAMRETQKTLEKLNEPPAVQKRDWLAAPKQAVATSLMVILMTGAALLGLEEVNASFPANSGAEVTSTAPVSTVDPQQLALEQTLQSLLRAKHSIAELGDFAWPVNFGIVDPKDIEYKDHHQGISIKAELGDPVVAVNDGEVIFSGNELRGYGNLIVIQHDNDLVSVYGNNQFNYVDEGDTVRRGQLIGDIGKLQNEQAAGLYFEIRHNGEPEDPFNYLRGNQNSDMLSAR